MRTSISRPFGVLALAAAFGLGACGSDDAPVVGDEGEEETTTTAAGTDVTAGGAAVPNEFRITLTGGATEVPQPGDPDGAGTAEITIDATKGEVCSTITHSGIETPNAAHIHPGKAGEAGPPAVTLRLGDGRQCVTADATLLQAIFADPASYYVNVHNGPFPGGALRGQLR